jgi:Leu/Phe-tRNA-protein transferase
MRKSLGDMILIPPNGFNISKSLSPVIRKSAFPATANSRNQKTVTGAGKQINMNKTYIILKKK